jgi:hypothetical protein
MAGLDRPEVRAAGIRPNVSPAFLRVEIAPVRCPPGQLLRIQAHRPLARIPALKTIRPPPTSRARSSFQYFAEPYLRCSMRLFEASFCIDPGIPRKLPDRLLVPATCLYPDTGFVWATDRNAKSIRRSRSKRKGSRRVDPAARRRPYPIPGGRGSLFFPPTGLSHGFRDGHAEVGEPLGTTTRT